MKIFGTVFGISFFLFLFVFSNGNHKSINDQERKIASSSKPLASINWRRSYLTLEKSLVPFKGLTNTPGNDGEYLRRLVGKLIHKAHDISHEDYLDREEGLYSSYYAFLMTTLATPAHESSLMHFTRRPPNPFCYFSNDILAKQVKNPVEHYTKFYDKKIQDTRAAMQALSDNSQIQVLKKKIKDYRTQKSNALYLVKNAPTFFNALGRRPQELIKACKEFPQNEPKQQLLLSADYADVGVLMFNAKSHGDFFLTGRVFDFDHVVDYGVNYLYESKIGGFNQIVPAVKNIRKEIAELEKKDIKEGLSNKERRLLSNKKKFKKGLSCLFDLEKTNPREYYLRLIRGTWAGSYNSGTKFWTCRMFDKRFTNAGPSDGVYYVGKRNDLAFDENLKKIYDPNSKYVSLYHSYLPEDSVERKALFEILDNVLNQTDNHTYLDMVLKTNYDAPSIDENLIIGDAPGEVEQQVVLDPPPVVVVENSQQDEAVEEVTVEVVETRPVNQESPAVQESNESQNSNETEETIIAEATEEARNNEPEVNSEAVEVTSNETSENTENSNSSSSEESVLESTLPTGDDGEEIAVAPDTRDEANPPKIEEEIPQYKPEDYKHYIAALRVIIRSQPMQIQETVCGNTGNSNRPKPLKVVVIDGFEADGYLRVSSKGLEDTIDNKKETCKKADYFIHKSLIKEVKAPRIEVTDVQPDASGEFPKQAKLTTSVTLRDKAGMTGSMVVGTFVPWNEFRELKTIIITNKTRFPKRDGAKHYYYWFEFINEDGEKVWFYGGKDNYDQLIEFVE